MAVLSGANVGLLLVCFVDTFAEQLVWATLLLWLGENAGASNGAVAWVMGAVRIVDGLVMLVSGRYLDHWPSQGPIYLLVMTNPPRALLIVAIVALEWLGESAIPTSDGRFAVYATVLIVPYAIFDGLDALAFSLAINRQTQRQREERRALLSYAYGLGNLAAAAASFVTAWVRDAYELTLANRILLLMATGVWLVATALAAVLAPHLQSQARPRGTGVEVRDAATSAPILLDSEEPSSEDSGGSAVAVLPPTFDDGTCSTRLRSLEFHVYLLFVLCFGGLYLAAVQNGQTMPKYTIWRHDADARFALYQAINPLLVAILALLLPPLESKLGLSRIPQGWLLLLGTGLQATAGTWIFASGGVEWSIAAFQLHWTLGEVLTAARAEEIEQHLAPSQMVGLFKSLKQAPALLLTIVAYASSGALLDTFCANDDACKRPEAPLLWLCTSIVALSTVVTLAGYHFCIGIGTRKRRRRKVTYTRMT